ncbi:hypothetical protein [Rubrivirga sp. IMCC45206]|uniref:hypothetical protein n=1 Tax=Rubrivirga sp. IMCC45206 TaxID=3391614 RepID=UPI00398FB469
MTPTPPDVSADTIPKPGDVVDGRTVRASGTLPVDGRQFVVLRHSARQQVHALGNAERLARTELGIPSSDAVSPPAAASYAAALLIADAARVRKPDADDWRRIKLDDVLDLDADDFAALNAAGGDDAPGPPSPTS